ncbi:MAG: hypothetical protein QXX84_06960 [Sulfolobales archaeon]
MRLDKELVLGGKGYVFINGIPFAYASGFELRAEWETSTLARSHAVAPDRIFYKTSNWTLTIPVKQVLIKLHYGTLFSAADLTGETLRVKDVDGITDSGGNITFTDIIPAGYSLSNASSVPLIVSTLASKFDLYAVPATITGDDVSFSGLPANAQVKAYLVFSKSGDLIRFTINTQPRPAVIEGVFLDPLGGGVGIKIYKAIPRNLSFTGIGDDFMEQNLEFQVMADETGAIGDMWLIE